MAAGGRSHLAGSSMLLLVLLLLDRLEPMTAAGSRLLRSKGSKVHEGADLLACGYSAPGTRMEDKAAILVDRERYPFCHVLSNGQVAVYWTHDGVVTTSEQQSPGSNNTAAAAAAGSHNITFMLVAKTMSPWLALGLSREGTGMKGMDVALLIRDEDQPGGGGGFRLEDRYSPESSSAPVLDERQDKTLLWARQANGLTSFSFTMPVHNCGDTEQRDVSIAHDRFTNVMYAYGGEAGDTEEEVFGYHGPGNRGAAALPLLVSDAAELSGMVGRVTAPADAKVMEVRVKDVPIRSNESTNVWCMFVEMPTDVKYHLYDFQAIKDPRTADQLHHIGLFDCKFTEPDHPLNQPFDCVNKGETCFPIASYSRNSSYPSPALAAEAGAGWPFGAGSSKYWQLSVHLENRQGLTGLRDSSGVRITYSPTLRPHDMGSLTVGAIYEVPKENLTSDLLVPPGLPTYDYVTVCPSTCTKKVFPPSGVKVLSANLHMHLRGAGGVVEVVRANGTKFSLTQSTSYDGWNVAIDMFAKPVELLPGDHLITTCIYNTTGRTSPLKWGWDMGRKDEMCNAFIFYYPAVDSAACFNYEGVRQPLLDWFKSLSPNKSYAMCVDGQHLFQEATVKDALPTVVVVPPEEQQVVKERRGKTTKLGELKASSQQVEGVCGQAQLAT